MKECYTEQEVREKVKGSILIAILGTTLLLLVLNNLFKSNQYEEILDQLEHLAYQEPYSNYQNTPYEEIIEFYEEQEDLLIKEQFEYEVRLLTEALYFEGDHQSKERDLGYKSIMANILNRVKSKHFPNSIEEVIYQPKKYSYTLWKDRRYEKINKANPTYKRINHQVRIWLTQYYDGKFNDPTKGSLYYYSPKGMVNGKTPNWVEDKYYTVTIADHRFYRWHKLASN